MSHNSLICNLRRVVEQLRIEFAVPSGIQRTPALNWSITRLYRVSNLFRPRSFHNSRPSLRTRISQAYPRTIQKPIPEHKLESDVARFTDRPFTVLVVGPALGDTAGTVDEQSVAPKHEIKRPAARLKITLPRVVGVKFELFKTGSEIAVRSSLIICCS